MAIGSGANRPLAEWGKHRLRWPHKDLEVALAVAKEAGVEMPFVAQLPRLMEELTSRICASSPRRRERRGSVRSSG
ncbi:MAG: hypothetical protein H0T39_11730, partial [Actinobacteria bacterium]|nr:hypothetical protein [Actinomycetota bacterium]